MVKTRNRVTRTAQKRGQPVSQKPATRKTVDWSGFAFPKREPHRKTKARKGRKALKSNRSIKDRVFRRDAFLCRAFGVSPICQMTPVHRHELIPRGRGGKVTMENCVAICAADHRACQNAVGGLPLEFVWPGKAEGRPPDANALGAVTAVWKAKGTKITATARLGLWFGPERRKFRDGPENQH